MARIPTEKRVIKITKAGTKRVQLHSYVITLTEQDGSEVKAIRADGFQNKEDVYTACIEQHVGWNIKSIQRLYETDFDVQ